MSLSTKNLLSESKLSKLSEKELRKEIGKSKYSNVLIKSDHGNFFEGISLAVIEKNVLAAAAVEMGFVLDARSSKKGGRARSSRSRSPSPAPAPATDDEKADDEEETKPKRGRKKGSQKKPSKKTSKKRTSKRVSQKEKEKEKGGAKKAGRKPPAKRSSKKSSKKSSEEEEEASTVKKEPKKRNSKKKNRDSDKKTCEICNDAPANARVSHSAELEGRKGVTVCKMCEKCADKSKEKCRLCGGPAGDQFEIDVDKK